MKLEEWTIDMSISVERGIICWLWMGKRVDHRLVIDRETNHREGMGRVPKIWTRWYLYVESRETREGKWRMKDWDEIIRRNLWYLRILILLLIGMNMNKLTWLEHILIHRRFDHPQPYWMRKWMINDGLITHSCCVSIIYISEYSSFDICFSEIFTVWSYIDSRCYLTAINELDKRKRRSVKYRNERRKRERKRDVFKN